MTRTKGVILLIVEGFSDETIFANLKKTYSDYNITFINIRGDIFGDINSNANIKNRIIFKIKEQIQQRKLKKTDIIGVLQVIDLDGCMIKSENVVIDNNISKNIYYENEFIKVNNCNQKKFVEDKNKLKNYELQKVCTFDHIATYKYQIYYFSRAMEHVIFDEPNPEDNTKVKEIDKFMETLTLAIEDFLSDYLPPVQSDIYSCKYEESWKYTFENNNSLHRCSNVSLLFEFIKTLVE
ncbi:MAG: hypothetical protein JJE21_03900 [Spirochaetaceae bacterium]|nr:hypothetical protein [Spirochaetaceae bacterium]